MPTYTIHCHTPLTRSFRVEQVAGLFDLPLEEVESRLAHELTVELPGLEEDWTIGAIVGPSGSGKTTLARAVYGEALYDPPPWPADSAIIDCLGDAPIKQIAATLTAVGLGSVPTWLKPYRVLSTGERFRADLARALLAPGEREASASRYDGVASPAQLAPQPDRETHVSRSPVASRLLVIDEFTSTLDRTVACTASAALARLLRNPKSAIQNPKLVILTCHTDILPWLAPDWVLDLAPPLSPGGRGAGGEGAAADGGRKPRPLVAALWRCLQRPQLHLAVCRVPQRMWRTFAGHHYLAGGLAASATCYAAFLPAGDGGQGTGAEGLGSPANAPLSLSPVPRFRSRSEPVAFCATVASLGWKKTKRITRLVTLPEFQGLGIASRLAETVAAHEQRKGHRVTITASHPAILAHCSRSPRWKYLGLKKTGSTRQRLAGRPIACSAGRAVASFEFVPP
jgi:GNAT superfamily N-acetyltransferase